MWLDERLSMLDKGILIEIDSLDNGEDGCFASNEHLAKFCQCSERKVSESISKLVSLGYVNVASFDGRKRFLRSCLEKTASQTSKNCEADSQKLRDSNTSRNTRRNTNKSISRIGADNEIYHGFDDFWRTYPRKVSKPTAIRAWNKLKPSDDVQSAIAADISKRLASEWAGKDIQYIPHPASYLNQRRWEDETTSGMTQEPSRIYEDADYENNW